MNGKRSATVGRINHQRKSSNLSVSRIMTQDSQNSSASSYAEAQEKDESLSSPEVAPDASPLWTLPLAPPYSYECIQWREELLAKRDSNAPRFVYHLYTKCQEEGQPPAHEVLQRTYISYELANHDAACWILDQQDRLKPIVNGVYKDKEYEQLSNGRCCKISSTETNSRDWGRSFNVWTVEQPLY